MSDPADLHRLEHTLEELRKVSKQTWAEATSSGDQDATRERGPADHAVARAE